jgi:outer membrane lipoprotein-sorting protein
MLLVLGATSTSAQTLPSVDEVAHHLDELYRSNSSHSMMTMRVVRGRGPRELTLESWTRGVEDALIVIRSPAREAGTATLRTEEGLWNYAPRADRLIRIPSGLLSESWMGSHFTNDDLLRDTGYRDDHDLSVAWGTLEGTRYVEVTMTPKPEAPVVYTSLVFWLVPDTWVPVRAQYFDEGDVVRTMVFDHVEEIAGRLIPLRMLVQPEANPEEYTEIIYEELQLDIDMDAEMFTRRGLRRIAGN